ncbi:LiaI-LiaF-like domain-containing protein [Lutispora thermophila]|uniref:LiaI-LiaF-like transmembrane region domain-containing protein n=1 Tax=Lutispora thermophila DSM 19022 TaxID=1122184 RepID=A0A1M6FLE4_9FIRM|nr:DUF5668 domain-containing protein [Lutispora thermophila]SHI98486.1 hypothetical protein SAMN02745176_02030 [Lutispora thermophila DSM 19022]
MKKNQNIFIGISFIIVGTLFLLSNLGYINFSWSYIWPLALLAPGVYLHFSFFTGLDKNPGILVPAGILTTYGLLFYANVFFGWGLMADLWPVFLIGISIGLLELYIFGSRDNALLVPIAILGGLGIIFLTDTVYILNRKYLAPAFLIVLGILILTKNDNRKNASHNQHNPHNQYQSQPTDNNEIIVKEDESE